MNKSVGFLLFLMVFGLYAQVGKLDFQKKYDTWRFGNPDAMTYADFKALVDGAQGNDKGLEHVVDVVSLPTLSPDKVFTYRDASGKVLTTTLLIMALMAQLPKIVGILLNREASLTLQSAWRVPFEQVLTTKEKLIRDVVLKNRNLMGKNVPEGELVRMTMNLTPAEQEEINRLAPQILHAKIAEYTPVIDVLKKYAKERNDLLVTEGIEQYQQKFLFFVDKIKTGGAYGANAA